MTQTIRAIVFRDSGNLIAQCLEHDICVQAENAKTLRARLEVAIEAELELCKSEGRDLSSLPKAPEHFFAMWEKRSSLVDKNETVGGVGYEMALYE
jgi:hypothetical protein